MADFKKLLSKKVAETEKPKPRPIGTYLVSIIGQEFREVGKNKTEAVDFKLSFLSPQDDVDVADLTGWGGIEKLRESKDRDTFFLTEDSLWRLAEFLENVLGLPIGDKSYGEVIAETTGATYYVHYNHEMIERDGKSEAFARIDSRSKA